MRTNVRWLSISGIAIRYNRKDISITVIKGPEASLTAKSVLQCLHKLPNTQASSGRVSLTRAQLSMLCEGIDCRQPARTWQPLMTV
jgi:hypothetical protein